MQVQSNISRERLMERVQGFTRKEVDNPYMQDRQLASDFLQQCDHFQGDTVADMMAAARTQELAAQSQFDRLNRGGLVCGGVAATALLASMLTNTPGLAVTVTLPAVVGMVACGVASDKPNLEAYQARSFQRQLQGWEQLGS